MCAGGLAGWPIPIQKRGSIPSGVFNNIRIAFLLKEDIGPATNPKAWAARSIFCE